MYTFAALGTLDDGEYCYNEGKQPSRYHVATAFVNLRMTDDVGATNRLHNTTLRCFSESIWS